MNSPKRAQSLIPVRIGALLVAADILRPPVMQQALTRARQSRQRLGQVLVDEHLISPDDLQRALELQVLIKKGDLTVEMGTQALRESRLKGSTIDETLSALGYREDSNIGNVDLAEILLQSGLITKPQLDQARWNAGNNGLPLGRNLVLSGAISPSTLGSALTVLILIRDKRIVLPAGVAALKITIDNHFSVDEVLNLHTAVSPNHVRVGELLSNAGLLSESDAMIAAENALLHRRSIGQVLLEYGMISPLVLDSALKLQGMIEQSAVTPQQAAVLLRQVNEHNVGLDKYLSEMAQLKRRVLELLLESGTLTTTDVRQALQGSPEYETDILRALFANQLLSQDQFRAAVRCAHAIDDGSSSKEEAIECLRETFVGFADDDRMLFTA